MPAGLLVDLKTILTVKDETILCKPCSNSYSTYIEM